MAQRSKSTQRGKAVWLVCGGMRRGGSTLQYHLVSSLVERSCGEILGLTSPEKFPEQYKLYRDKYGFLVVKCHRVLPNIERLALTEIVKPIYIMRDIRDVCVSLQYKHGESFVDMIRQGFPSGILSEYCLWTGLPGAYVSKYEIVVGDVPGEVKKLAGYLGITVSKTEINRIAEQHSLSRQKENISNFNYDTQGEGQGHNRYDPGTLLHPDHIRSGKSEQWRRELTTLQVAYIEHESYEFLVDEGYEVSQSWVIRQWAMIYYWFSLRVSLVKEYNERGVLEKKIFGKLLRLVGLGHSAKK